MSEPTSFRRHTDKIRTAIHNLPPVLTHKADVSIKVAPNSTITQDRDGGFSLKLYDTVIVRRSRATTYVDTGGHETATTMVWILSALEALGLPNMGTRAGGVFEVNDIQVDGLTQVAE